MLWGGWVVDGGWSVGEPAPRWRLPWEVAEGEQHWTLIDNDPVLLAAVPSRLAAWASAGRTRFVRERTGAMVLTGPGFECRARTRALDLAGGLEDQERVPEEPFVGSSAGNDEAAEWAVSWLPEGGDAVAESYVNLIPTIQGGTHVNGLRAGLTEAVAGIEVVKANADVMETLLADYVDVVFANEEEAKAFTGSDDPVDFVQQGYQQVVQRLRIFR